MLGENKNHQDRQTNVPEGDWFVITSTVTFREGSMFLEALILYIQCYNICKLFLDILTRQIVTSRSMASPASYWLVVEI